jgi:hypothetical protein
MSYQLLESEEILEILKTLHWSFEFSTRHFFANALIPMDHGYASIGNKLAYAFIYYCYQNGNNNKDHLCARFWTGY